MGEVVYIPENLSEFQIPGNIKQIFYIVLYKTIISYDSFQIWDNSCIGYDNKDYSCFDNNISHNNDIISIHKP